ncbi:hypothetical protein SAY87_025293 [Trapa incisa]|uniref:Eukaryotic translation initiation factor 4G n=1 Tax=Trapa incisa TaxID=236973 RepID=A0AAN7GFN0_9MYRT|nr:hypothetical protein SAY87_025293 [Trapa incisa]
MSYNQSRFDKNDSSQYRKSGRSASFNNPRTSSGAYAKGGAPAPSPSIASSAASRSFKKPGNAQGVQSRVSLPSAANRHLESNNAPSGPLHNLPSVTAHSATRDVPNTTSGPAETTPAPPRGTQIVQETPAAQPTSMNSDATAPTTPVKAPGDASKAFAFQFGSISPGFVNGMQVPARISSAPPNIDEQKRDKAHHDSVKSVHPIPIPPAPARTHLPGKDLGSGNHPRAPDVQSTSKPKRDTQGRPVTPIQAHNTHVNQVSRMSIPMSYHQLQVPIKFTAPNSQIQSQGLPSASIQMPMQIPMALPVANAPQGQQQMFVPGLQPHQLPPQGALLQSQGLSFPQMPPQLANLGMSTGQYTHQQGQLGGPGRTPVKITHPDTHQEVKLDKPSDTFLDVGPSGRPSPNMPPQSQLMTSYQPGHQYNYYHTYNSGTMFFPGPGSLPVPGAQITASQATRYNYPINQAPQIPSFVNPQGNNLLTSTRAGVSKQGTVEQPQHDFAQNPRDISSSTRWEVVKQTDVSMHKNAAIVSLPRGSTAGVKIEPPKVSGLCGESSQKEPEIGHVSSPKPEALREPLSYLSSATSQHDSGGASTISIKSVAPSNSNADYPPLHEVSRSTDVNAEVGNRVKHSGSNSNNNANKEVEIEGGRPLSQVEDRVPTVSGLSLHTLVPTNIVNEGVRGQDNNFSVSRAADIVLEPRNEAIRGGDAVISKERTESMGNDGVSFPSEEIDDSITIRTSHSGSNKDDGLDVKTIKGEGQESTEHAGSAKVSFANSWNGSEPSSLKSSELKENEPMCNVEDNIKSTQSQLEVIGKIDDTEIATPPFVDGTASKPSECTVNVSQGSHGNNISSSGTPESGGENMIYKDRTNSADNSSPKPQEKSRIDVDAKEKSAVRGGSMQILSSSHKPVPELNRSKSMTGKIKRRELLKKADADGSTLDLYMAYKGPEEKKEITSSSEGVDIASSRASSNSELPETYPKPAIIDEDGDEGKAEPDDWEDVAEISTPELNSTANGKGVDHQEGDGFIIKKYSRDFLLKFADQYTSLPEDFELTSSIAEVFSNGMNGSRSVGRDHQQSPGRSTAGPRMDRRGSNVREDDRWNKVPGAFASGQDLRLDVGFGGNLGYRPGQGANFGVLRNPRAQSPIQYSGSILPGLIQPLGSQGGMQRAGSDSDRWQRATGFQQKGLIPSPQTPLQMMHKAEKKYEVGKVSDEEEIKQRQLKAILNKLTPQNFEKLFNQVIEVNIDNTTTLNGLISQIFDKALMEPTFCEMYANLCSKLSQALPDFSEGDEKITFKRLLLNKCQEEFERDEREQEEADKLDEEGEAKQSEKERETKRMKARRRMLGNIRFIGELYKKKMLTEKIMHDCMKKLLGQYQTPDEEDLEALCKLMSTIGEMIDHEKAKVNMDAYFARMMTLSNDTSLSSRVRFMLKDAIDLRKNKWQQRRKVEGPKKIEEVHRDAAQERHSQAGRVSRSSGINSSRRGQQMESSPRVNPLSSPIVQVSSFRNMPSQARGYGAQDARFEERQPYEPRTLAVSSSQKFGGDDAITLGPQGGLGRGLSVRGSSSVMGTSLADLSSSAVDSRRNLIGLNGFNSLDQTNSYSSREDSTIRSASDSYRGPAIADHPNMQGGKDVRSPRYSSDRPASASSYSKGNVPALTQNNSEKAWDEDKLRDKSIAAIREYYSAKDEKEVVLCIKELNSPSFYPSVISLWVTDSFERKDNERDLLTKLLVNLSKPQDGTLNQGQLIEGFESVLSTLEDAVNDAPKAPEFIGRIFGKLIVENVIPLSEIGRILQEGGEEPGQLLEAGLAADALGYTLEAIQSDREADLIEIRKRSKLRLEDFRPRGPNVSTMLEKFIKSQNS